MANGPPPANTKSEFLSRMSTRIIARATEDISTGDYVDITVDPKTGKATVSRRSAETDFKQEFQNEPPKQPTLVLNEESPQGCPQHNPIYDHQRRAHICDCCGVAYPDRVLKAGRGK